MRQYKNRSLKGFVHRYARITEYLVLEQHYLELARPAHKCTNDQSLLLPIFPRTYLQDERFGGSHAHQTTCARSEVPAW